MKIIQLFILFLTIACMEACIQDEPPNAEADIIHCSLKEDVLKKDPTIENNRVFLMVKPGTDLTHLTLFFKLTPGATIKPPSGTTLDFSVPQTYVVTSEDGKWTKEYSVTCSSEGIPTAYHFEHFELVNNKYYTFFEIPSGSEEKQYIWASGNKGFSLIAGNKKPEEFPTTPYEFGEIGNCLKIETKSTGFLGSLVNMPIAAGNLFIGEFTGASTNKEDALKSTHFGLPFDFIPQKITGYYKYKKGDTFTDENGNVVNGKTDSFDIYGIVYETDEQVKFLDGTNSLTSTQLVLLARMKESQKVMTDKWTYFELDFETVNNKAIEADKLSQGKYNVSIIFSSSIEGQYFRGAVGSRLLIDEIELIPTISKQ